MNCHCELPVALFDSFLLLCPLPEPLKLATFLDRFWPNTKKSYAVRLDINPDKVTHALAKIREAGLPVTPATSVTPAIPTATFFSNAPKPPPLTICDWKPGDFPDQWAGTKIVTAREFLAIVTGAVAILY